MDNEENVDRHLPTLPADEKRPLEDGDESDAMHIAKRQKPSEIGDVGERSNIPVTSLVESARRKKVAMLLAYSGHGYHGMQRNPDVHTIESDLLSALLKAGIITQENVDVPQTMHFQRAARTDKGVSAARQVVSLRIAFSEGLVEKINDHLPQQIKVFDIKKGTRGFNSKLWCDARSYSYTLPTFAFAPFTERVTHEYRITEKHINRVTDILEIFKGSHNFHNFTSGKKFEDESAKRYIMDFNCGNAFVEGNMELIVLTVKGQSFMLHQIRKMIGLLIAIMRELTNPDIITRAYGPEKLDLPIAPGIGLVLEEVHYERYNQRYGSDGIHETLDWSNLTESIDKFKKDFIYPTIVNAEKEDKNMIQWLSTLLLHTFDVREPGANRSPHYRTEFGRALVNIANHDAAKRESIVATDVNDETTTEHVSSATNINFNLNGR